MHTSAIEALWLLIPALPLGIYIAWSDLATMRIPNRSVLLLAGAFLVFGLIALPLETWAWRLVQMAAVLALGFVANMARLIGGGDAKYAAAMAPYFAPQDASLVMILLAAMLLGAFVSHRALRMIPIIRRLTPEWKSWNAGRDFPMGLALSGTLLGYLALAAAS